MDKFVFELLQCLSGIELYVMDENVISRSSKESQGLNY